LTITNLFEKVTEIQYRRELIDGNDRQLR